MNRHIAFIILVLVLIKMSAFGQATFIEADSLTVTCNKTTHLIFPYAIRSIDRGSPDVLAQRAPGSDNVLQLKAAKAGFEETNITVITTDNKLYSFKVNYGLLPQHLIISFASDVDSLTMKNSIKWSVETNIDYKQSDAESLQQTFKQVATEKRRMYAIHAHNGLINLQLKSLYIKNDVFYFQFKIHNSSNISFDIRNVSFTIKDSKKTKRTAVQENVLQPLWTNYTDSTIQSHSSKLWVVAVPKFTLEAGKYLSIQIFEENGGRNLALKVHNRHLLAAKTL